MSFLKASILFICIFIGFNVHVQAQDITSLMEIRVEVVTGISGEFLEIEITDTLNNTGKYASRQLIFGKPTGHIQKEASLLYKVKASPNQELLFSLDPVQSFKNEDGSEVTFQISSIYYTYSPDRDELTPIDTNVCESVKTDNSGVVFFWVKGQFLFPESVKGRFVNNTPVLTMQCEEFE
ncbi:hypothetical protein [Gracilimonas amylolytica]|uniref:hypothetical protein n=1 Tax=Gracilimonas amylolytica TaxID=1749045 RepID=UPI000CD7F0F2|nr:hypothetical protein [Gracilimonas amylolytica]